MKSALSFSLALFLSLSFLSVSQSYDFFYFVQEWTGSLCDLKKPCCFASNGKPPVDFHIRGLWPNFLDGSFAYKCSTDEVHYDPTSISDLASDLAKDWPNLACGDKNNALWRREYNKYGTCTYPVLDQHDYFEAALDLKSKANLLGVLKDAGIEPKDGEYYSLSSIIEAIKGKFGESFAVIRCNKDKKGDPQIREVQLCVDKTATEFIKCPLYPRGSCPELVKFPAISSGLFIYRDPSFMEKPVTVW